MLRLGQYKRLIVADARNISRDATLAFAIIMAILPMFLLYAFEPRLTQWSLSTFAYDLGPLAMVLALPLPAFLIGWVGGFLLLDDRDDGVLLAVQVTPVGKGGFMQYRMALISLVSGILAVATVLLNRPEWGLLAGLGFALLAGLQAMFSAFVLPALARNKVEGLAITKLTNILMMGGLLALIPGPWRFLCAFVPTFWVGELAGLPPGGGIGWTIGLPVALAVQGVAVWLVYRAALARLG